MKTTNTYDKMQLQRDLMDCWLTALDNPMRSRVIIELDEEEEPNAWTDEDGNTHALNKYIMIDGSDGEHLFDDGQWWISQSWGDNSTFVKPEQVLPTAIQIIDDGHVKEIYNDGY